MLAGRRGLVDVALGSGDSL